MSLWAKGTVAAPAKARLPLTFLVPRALLNCIAFPSEGMQAHLEQASPQFSELGAYLAQFVCLSRIQLLSAVVWQMPIYFRVRQLSGHDQGVKEVY